jgi:crossover junction endodeoxyribonuclease RusA
MMTDETVISEPLQFFVAGDPIPEGSTRAFLVKGKPRITHGNAAMDQWRQRIATEAQHASGGAWYIAKRDGTGDGVDISLEFLIPRPAGARGDAMPTKRPDVDKLERAALDALTEVLFDDDSQVLRLTGEKVYQAVGSSPGVRVTVSRRMP